MNKRMNNRMDKRKAILCFLLVFFSFPSFSAVLKVEAEQCKAMTTFKVMSPKAPVQCERLRRVTFKHYDFGGHVQTGTMVVIDAVAPYVERIFSTLYQKKFPIAQAQPIEQFAGSDDKSMEMNNSSGFNYRAVVGLSSLSLHAYGAAIDINPLQNPYVTFTSWGSAKFKPLKSHRYVNRMKYRLNKEAREGLAEEVISVFADNGFIYWGGYWDSPIDYQHFQTSRDMAYLMAAMPEKEASTFFSNYVDWIHGCKTTYGSEKMSAFSDYTEYLQQKMHTTTSLNRLYKKAPERVIAAVHQEMNVSEAYCFK